MEMKKDCHEEAKGEGLTPKMQTNNLEGDQTQISNFRKASENSSSWDLLAPRVHSFRSNIPKQITPFEEKNSLRCFEMIRSYAFKAAAWKFTSKVDALPDDLNNIPKCAETELVKSPIVQRFGSMNFDSNHTKIGLLQCKWKNGLPQHMFTVDDKRGIMVADLSKEEASSSTDCVYTFRSSKRNDIIIGKMEVSTSITIGWDNMESSEETKSVLSITSDEQMIEEMEEIQTSDHRFKPQIHYQRIPSSKFDGSTASEEKHSAQSIELAAIVIKRSFGNRKAADFGGWGLKFLEKLRLAESLEVTRKNDECSTSMNVLIPNGIHGGPRTSSSLTERWVSGGECDCGGWDIACPLTVLSKRSNSDDFGQCKSVDLHIQGSKRDCPAWKMVKIQEDLYYVRFRSNISSLQSFAIATAIVHSCSPAIARSKLYRDII